MLDREDQLNRDVLAMPAAEYVRYGPWPDWPVDRDWVLFHEFAPGEDGAWARVWVQRKDCCYYSWRLTFGDMSIETGTGAKVGVLMMDLGHAIAEGMVTFQTTISREEFDSRIISVLD